MSGRDSLKLAPRLACPPRLSRLSETLYGYLIEHSLREPPLLKELREETARLPLARMQIAPEQGQFMALLVKL
ncbi:MAG TPA: hypothetical protein VLA73_00360, partial [Burkholderiales bacterium]|nr:hypothetical protein [Burkholderiales bacterium]